MSVVLSSGQVALGMVMKNVGSFLMWRFALLEKWCNRHGKTIDNEVTLFLKYVFQAYVRRAVLRPSGPEFDKRGG